MGNCWLYPPRTFTHDGKKKIAKEKITAIDEEKKLVTFKVISGDLMEVYNFAKQILNSPKTCKTNPYDINYIVHLLETCTATKSLRQGKTIHQYILKHNHNNNTNKSILLDKLAHLYIQCNKPHFAYSVFNTIPYVKRQKKGILWNQMIRAYAWDGPFEKAVELYQEMVRIGVKPTKYTYPFVLKACAGLKDVENGVKIHYDVERFGLGGDIYVCTALVDFYVKCGWLERAWELFDAMSERDVVAWNVMISGCSKYGFYEDVIGLVLEMQQIGVRPNSSTIVAMLPVIGEVSELSVGKAVHCYCIRRGYDSDVVAGTGILDIYGKCGWLIYAREIFCSLRLKNEVTWSAMIGACVTCDSTREGLELFEKMRVEDGVSASPVLLATVIRGCATITDLDMGKQMHGYVIKLGCILDLMVGNTLLSMYAKCGMIGDAMRFFKEMGFNDSVSYSAIISGCVQNGNAEEALKIFRRMQVFGVEPELATMMGFLPACSHLAAVQHGYCGHGYSIVRGFTQDLSICNALIDMYSKCGKIDAARIVFDGMSKRDVVSWNAMIIGYGVHGLGRDAISMFHDMQTVGQKPDEVTFIGLLSACSHSGLVTEGKHWFLAMGQEYNIFPRMDHYLCMVDLLARAGLLDEAHKFILGMPYEPDVRIWNALLAACRIHKNIDLGEQVSNKIQSLGPESTGNFVLLSNLYSTAERWDDAAHVRVVQKDSGFNKSPGCSWVEVNGIVHAFFGGDRSHPQSPKINEKLNDLLAEMKKLGYRAESSFVYQDVEEEEKEQILLYHSEKLAVAFGILSLNPNKPILVAKNLRVCGDCHTALKYISIITKREIVVRDTNRFHHFRVGICSCGDFW